MFIASATPKLNYRDRTLKVSIVLYAAGMKSIFTNKKYATYMKRVNILYILRTLLTWCAGRCIVRALKGNGQIYISIHLTIELAEGRSHALLARADKWSVGEICD